jgi:transcriptional regulator with XRE-family HTH domain
MDNQAKRYAFEDFPSHLSLLVEQKMGGKQRRLADLAQLSPQAINTYIKPPDGRPRIPKGEELYRIAKALDVSMEYLLTGMNTDEATGCEHVETWKARAQEAERKLELIKSHLIEGLKKI